ncbi:MAG: hypothetical protein JNK46_17785 [Methylobacteriaceae bacterium]|nr:hypothetical protein [Methylobacteriaceae bacterium]
MRQGLQTFEPAGQAGRPVAPLRQKDPRAAACALRGVDRLRLDAAARLFGDVARAVRRSRGGPTRLLDLDCGFGFVSALIRWPLRAEQLLDRYRALAAAALGVEDLALLDQHFFRAWPRPDIAVVGLDASASALRYARRVGVLDATICADLETAAPKPDDARKLAGVDLVIAAGLVGEQSLSRLFAACPERKPWFVCLAPRSGEGRILADLCAAHGFVVEDLAIAPAPFADAVAMPGVAPVTGGLLARSAAEAQEPVARLIESTGPEPPRARRVRGRR